MLVIKDIYTVPPESWSYYISPTGQTIATRNYQMLYPMIRQHCVSNNIQPPTEQEVVDYICANAHVFCYESETRTPLINKFTMGLPNPSTVGTCCGGR